MIKKLAIFASIALLLTVMTFNSGTGAWFTDSKISGENIFQAGVLNIEGPGGITTGMSVGNLCPGWQSGDEPESITIVNSGTLDFDYSISCEPLLGNLLYDGPTPIQININETGFVDINMVNNFFLGSINRNSTGSFKVRFRLPEAANDAYSDQAASFSFKFDAIQKVRPTDPGKAPDIEPKPDEQNTKPVFNISRNVYYSSLSEAVKTAVSGDSIRVAAGTYTGNVSIDKPLTLHGPNINKHPQYDLRNPEAIINGAFILNSDNIFIEGFEITNPGNGEYFGIRGNAPGIAYNNITIGYNNFHDIGNNAIRYGLGYGGGTGTKNWYINNNLITKITGSNVEAFKLYNITGLKLERNYIRHSYASAAGRCGVFLEGVSNAAIESNDISLGGRVISAAPYIIQIGIGSYQQGVSNFSIKNNEFEGSYKGITTSFKGNLSDIFIEGNRFSNIGTNVSIQSGIDFGKITNVSISGNSFENSSIGLSFAAYSPYIGIKVTGNKFSAISGYYIYAPNKGAFLSGNIDASLNWWGTSVESEIKGKMSESVTFSPWHEGE
jgi:hypothetical protein